MSTEPWAAGRFFNRKLFFGGGGSSGGSSTTTSNPWSGQQPYLEDLYEKAQTAQGKTPTKPYTGPLTAGPTGAQTQANQAAISLANANMGVGNQVQQLGQDTVAGKYLDPASNPALQAGINAALNPIYERYTRQVMPQVTSNAIAGGAYGGARHGLGLAQASTDLAREGADASARIVYDNYQRERDRQLQGGNIIQQGLGLNTAPIDMLSQAGGQQQGWNQAVNDDQLTRYNMSLQSPWNGLNQYSSIIQGGMPGSSTYSRTSSGSPAGNAIQGALGGASLAGGLGSLAGATGLSALAPWLGIGAALGGAGSFF